MSPHRRTRRRSGEVRRSATLPCPGAAEGEPMTRRTRDAHRPAPARTPADWRLTLPEPRRRRLRRWFLSGAVLTFLILVTGGITRLTQSGLSIVDWQPIMGAIPPLNEAEWVAAFERYKLFPEYQKLRQGMTMAEFQFIFFWEWFHRLLARLTGLVFLLPAAAFWMRGYFPRPLLGRVGGLFALGVLQAFMGWYMVKSGLVSHPHVSHYRLAMHLSIALSIIGICLWQVRDLGVPVVAPRPGAMSRRALTAPVLGLGVLLLLQILWGALVAGLDAGLYFNTFPRMGGQLLPPGGWGLDPAVLNLVENPITVQWVHRVLGTVLALASLLAVVHLRRGGADAGSQRLAAAVLALMVVQYGLGVATLLRFVPVSLGALHQGTAVVIYAVWLVWLHHVRNLRPAPHIVARGRDRLRLPAARWRSGELR